MAFLPFLRGCSLSFALLFASACGVEADHHEATEASALYAGEATTEHAFEVLSAGRTAELRQVLSDLDRAATASDDGYASFYAGAFRIWAIVNSSSIGDLLALPGLAQDGLKSLGRGHQLLPNDFRATSFLGLGQLILGNTLGDKALVTAGLGTFETGLAQMPAYARYLRAGCTPSAHK